MDSAIEITGLSKKFNDLNALADITLKIKQREIFGLVGPDAAGKTTLIRILAGITAKTNGTIKIFGENIESKKEIDRNKIGYMPQNFSLYPDLTVSENLEFYAKIYGVGPLDFEKRKKELLGFTRLEKFKDRITDRLSGGMKQKLALAVALIHFPRLLILDEPSTGVDPLSRRDFWEILYSIPNSTIFVSTPYMDEAERCSMIGLLYKGRLLKVDTPSNIKISTGSRTLNEAFKKIISEKANG